MEDLKNKEKMRKKRRKKHLPIKIFIALVIALVLLLVTGWLYGNNLLSKIKRTEINENDLGIKDEVNEKIQTNNIKDIVNIAILGVDESENDAGRSDATMIATFDPIHKKLKITSIMRDTYADIPGYGKDKLNHAYAYGGPQLSIKTLNQDFGLNIKDYVKINFEELEGLIDAIGGIDMKMEYMEKYEVNNYIERYSEARNITEEKLVMDEKTGKYHLTGFQTLGYCRIRSIGNGDFDRTERHRKIMTEMFNKISKAGTAELASMATKLLPYVETSLSNKEIINLATNVLNLGTKNIEQERFPRDEYTHNSKINDIFYLCYDEDYTEEQIHEYIFNDRKMWLEPNPKVYNHDAEHSHGNEISDYQNTNTETIAPNTNVETEAPTPSNNGNTIENNTNDTGNSSNGDGSNNVDNTEGERTSTDTPVEPPTEGTDQTTNP
ncbi:MULTISPECIES: LCP family protein [unclassified Clostridium]|uniref:LCP family protein n=1 Tax=unclassified Clostridium TaxID=2614128 RepID=UPI0032173A19